VVWEALLGDGSAAEQVGLVVLLVKFVRKMQVGRNACLRLQLVKEKKGRNKKVLHLVKEKIVRLNVAEAKKTLGLAEFSKNSA